MFLFKGLITETSADDERQVNDDTNDEPSVIAQHDGTECDEADTTDDLPMPAEIDVCIFPILPVSSLYYMNINFIL